MKIRVVDSLVSIFEGLEAPDFWIDSQKNRVPMKDMDTDVVIQLVGLIATGHPGVLQQMRDNGFWDGEISPMFTPVYQSLVAEQRIRLDPPETEEEKAAKKKKGRKKKTG